MHEIYGFKISDDKLYLKEGKEYKRVKSYKIWIKSERETSYPENNYIKLNFFLPDRPKKNLTAVLHGFGAQNQKFWENLICKKFAYWGVPNFLIQLPYHMERKPKGQRSVGAFLKADPERIYLFFDQAQADIRKSLYLVARHFQLRESFNILGVSLGGITAFITTALEEKIKRANLIFAGACFNLILWAPITRLFIEPKCSRLRCWENYQLLHKEFTNVKDLKDLLKLAQRQKCFLYEPLNFVNFIKNRKDTCILIFAGLLDLLIPFKSCKILNEYLPNSKLVVLPCGHYSGIFLRDLILKRSFSFLL